MRGALSPIPNDPTLSKNFRVISEILNGNISIDNMKMIPLSGTTADTPDTAKLHQHGLGAPPSICIPLVGDVYIQEISGDYIDVRSTKPGVNFVVMMLSGGNEIVAEQNRSVGSDTYQTTTEYIQTTPIIITNTTAVTPIYISPTTCQVPTDGTNFGYSYNHVLAYGDYFYITCNTETNISDDLIRINRITGAAQTLTIGGGIPLSAMCMQGDTLYVSSSRYDGGTSINVYSVNTTTFSSVTTHTATGVSNSQSINDIYVDGSSIYLAHTTAGTINAILTKFAIGGGAATQLTLTSTSKRAQKIIPASDGSVLYVLVDFTAAASNAVYAVNHSTMAVSSTITLPAGRWDMAMMRKVTTGSVDYLLIPASPSTAKSTTSAAVTYGSAILIVNTSTGTTTQYPVPMAERGSTSFYKNLVVTDDYVYFVDIDSALGGCTVIRGDLIDYSTVVGWFPFRVDYTNTNAFQSNNILIADTDGEPVLIRNADNGPVNFEFFRPDFSNFSTG